MIVDEEFEWNGLQPNQSPASLLVKPGRWVVRNTMTSIGAGPAMQDGD